MTSDIHESVGQTFLSGSERGTPRPEPASRAILLTAPGAAAIAVIRFIGPTVDSFLQRHVRSRGTGILPGRPIHAELFDGDSLIDDPVILRTESFTDISIHGGPWIIRSVLDLAAREGFEVIDRHTPDPDIADGNSIIDREISAWLPSAKTELAIRALLAQRDLWNTDFSSEEAKQILADNSLYRLLNPPKLAIVGIPNAGKSTLANQFFGQQRSIVADVPGTTRDYISEYANIDGLPVMLLDTPGLRHTADHIEHQAILYSVAEIKCADVILLVLDPTSDLAEQQPLIDQFPTAIKIANKSDLPPRWQLEDILPICAKSGTGLDRLRTRIKSQFNISDDLHRPRWWTQRQRDLLTQSARNHA